MAESIEVVQERTRALEDAVRRLEARVRDIESRDVESLKQKVWRLEGRADSFESTHDDNKAKWNMVLNFVVQLMWVATASYVLAKLGLNTGSL